MPKKVFSKIFFGRYFNTLFCSERQLTCLTEIINKHNIHFRLLLLNELQIPGISHKKDLAVRVPKNPASDQMRKKTWQLE
jgi:hypothetical protein